MAEHRHKTVLSGDGKEDVTVSIKRINNGWIISRTVEKKGKKGEPSDFQTTKTYSAVNPEITVNMSEPALERAGLVRRKA